MKIISKNLGIVERYVYSRFIKYYIDKYFDKDFEGTIYLEGIDDTIGEGYNDGKNIRCLLMKSNFWKPDWFVAFNNIMTISHELYHSYAFKYFPSKVKYVHYYDPSSINDMGKSTPEELKSVLSKWKIFLYKRPFKYFNPVKITNKKL